VSGWAGRAGRAKTRARAGPARAAIFKPGSSRGRAGAGPSRPGYQVGRARAGCRASQGQLTPPRLDLQQPDPLHSIRIHNSANPICATAPTR